MEEAKMLCKLPDGRDWWWEKLDLALVSRALLSKAVIQLSADGCGCSLPGSCLVWDDRALGSMGSMVGLMVTSKRVCAKGIFLDCCCQCPSPCGEALPTHASTEDPVTLAGSFGSVSCGATAPFLWVLVCARCYLCPPRLESLFIPILWKSCHPILLALKVRFPEDSQSFCPLPTLGSLTWSSEPSQQGENVFGFIVFQFIGHPSGRYGIWFYHACAHFTISLWLLLSLDMVYLFLVGSNVRLSTVVQ